MEKTMKVILTRGDRPECVHDIHVAVCTAEGQLTQEWGDPHYETYWRSGAKPFQVLPLLLEQGEKVFHLLPQDIAVMSASHSGEAAHVAQVRSILEKIGCSEKDLECGPMVPLNHRAAKELQEQGIPATEIYNTCSGKHAAMLALAKLLKIETTGYSQPDHPVQIAMKEGIARSTDLPPAYIPTGVDGCGVPVFWLALSSMARAYGKLANPEKAHLSDEMTDALTKIRDSMGTHPFLVAGTHRIETLMMEKAAGRLVAKSGTDGIFCISHLPTSEGLVLKVADGAARALAPAALELSRELGWLTLTEYQELWHEVIHPLKNCRNEIIGNFEVSFS